MNQLKPIYDKKRHSLGVSGTLLTVSVSIQSFGSDGWGFVMNAGIVGHQADERDVVRVDGRANHTIIISIDGWREGLDRRVLRSRSAGRISIDNGGGRAR
jgi:hypothetical protein